jgi:4-alpha-glucanotransferase
MTPPTLQQRARMAGIEVDWTDAQGTAHTLSKETQQALLDVLAAHASDRPSHFDVVPAGAPLTIQDGGHALYHQETRDECPLALDAHGRALAPATPGYYTRRASGQEDAVLAVVPRRCISVEAVARPSQARCWGLAAQVYGLRRAGDGGLGDSLAIAELGEAVANAGGDAVGLSPLHAGGPADRDFSPYSPSHRAWLDTLQIAPAQVVGEEALRDALADSGYAQAWSRAEHQRLVDWPAQELMRRAVWKSLAHRWGSTTQARRLLDEFKQQGGPSLRLHAIFSARQRLACAQGQGPDWRRWEAAWRDANHPVVDEFATRHAAEVDEEYFAQWLATACWNATRQTLRNQGQGIGLVWDLATGFTPGGSEAWQQRHMVMQDVSIGAPPDGFNPHGQAWGLAAYAPNALRHHGYRPMRELLARMMARGGGLRIDHMLGWSRLWLVPQGMPPNQGGYVRYPLQDLLGLLALESMRHRCLVIGEDLGTVPSDLRSILAERGVLGIDVLQFARDQQGRFVDPSQWRRDAVAMSSTHDLPSLEGWRAANDITTLARVQHWSADTRDDALARRADDIAQLDRLLERFAAPTPRQAALRAVAESPSPLALFPLEDVLGAPQQPNLPGTRHDQHPNWRRRLLWRRPRLASALRLIARGRQADAHA